MTLPHPSTPAPAPRQRANEHTLIRRVQRVAVQALGQNDSPRARAAIRALIGRNDSAATDKLIDIAKQDENVAARRRTVDALGRLSDPRAWQALESMVDRRP